MLFDPKDKFLTGGFFVIPQKTHAVVHPCLNKGIIKEFWSGFNFGASELEITECQEYVIRIGNADPLALGGNDYSINVTPDGICVCAESESELIRGFMTLVDRIRAIDSEDGLKTVIDCVNLRDSALIKNRMVHFCIFPETELWEFERFIRYVAALKFSHLIVEFWGMLKYDCLGELSWAHAYSKEQIRPIIKLANDLGLQIIPMFNHWGHASASRVMYGKHVVLDQNPALCTYFSEDGWCWDISKPKVRELLRSIRSELIELCGSGDYFHIGCDEASIPSCPDCVKHSYSTLFKEQVKEMSEYVNSLGARTLMWHDMLLDKDDPRWKSKDGSKTNSIVAKGTKETASVVNELPKDVIICDWYYRNPRESYPNWDYFKSFGFDVIACPWDREGTVDMITKAPKAGLKGILGTIWNHYYGLSLLDIYYKVGSLTWNSNAALNVYGSPYNARYIFHTHLRHVCWDMKVKDWRQTGLHHYEVTPEPTLFD